MAQPGYADAISGLEAVHARAYRRNDAHYFMSGNHGDFRRSQLAIYNVQIRATNAARTNVDKQLAGAGYGVGNLHLSQDG
jgi:hypothetical protein